MRPQAQVTRLWHCGTAPRGRPTQAQCLPASPFGGWPRGRRRRGRGRRGGGSPLPPEQARTSFQHPQEDAARRRGGAPTPARGGRSARGRHPPSTAPALGPIASAVAAHQKETARKAKAALDAAKAAREEANAILAAEDLLADGSPPLPSTTPAPLRPPPGAPPEPAGAGGAPPGGSGDGDAATTLVPGAAPGGDGDHGAAMAPTPGATAPAAVGDAFVGGRMGAVLQNPPLLDPPTHAVWDAFAALHDDDVPPDPTATDIPILVYSEPQALPFETDSGGVPRESAFGATEPCLLHLSNVGVGGLGSGPHLTLCSMRRLDIPLHTLHTSCVGPMTPFHVCFEQHGMQPTPDTAYVLIHGNHLRRGLTIRFPPGMGAHLMPLCNEFLTSPAPSDPPRRPATLDIHALNKNPLGFSFYARSSDRLPKGMGYLDDPLTRSTGQRVVVALSRSSGDATSAASVTIRPDNTATSEGRFPLDDATFSVVRTPTGGSLPRKGAGRAPGARMHSRGRTPPFVQPSRPMMVQMEIKRATSSRRVFLDLFPSTDTRRPLTPTDVALACQHFLLASQGAATVDPSAPAPPPGQGAGDAAPARGAAAMANVGASPAEIIRARSAQGVIGQPPPIPAPDPVAESQVAAISQLRQASERQDKPHMVILADPTAPADWGAMIQRQACDLRVTAVSVSGGSLSRLIGAFLSARNTHPMPVKNSLCLSPAAASTSLLACRLRHGSISLPGMRRCAR